jgi:hypothetical protein
VLNTRAEATAAYRDTLRAVHVSAYGASLVHLDGAGQPLTPLYNYLKPYPASLTDPLFEAWGGAAALARETASPVLGMLNSGLQLYGIRQRQPEIFARIRYSLHLPQYISYLLGSPVGADITSIGCHTMLWDFRRQAYHPWVQASGLIHKFPPIQQGIGLHDSSAALIPYLLKMDAPFLLISTGTWCISLNPFNQTPLTDAELAEDCLCYLSFEGRRIKAARYFGGHEHEEMVRRLAAAFGVSPDFYTLPDLALLHPGLEQQYAREMQGLVQRQAVSVRLALGPYPVQRILVDGGFAANPWYMRYLAAAFPTFEVYAAVVAQASALGAALAIHPAWNSKPIPADLFSLHPYSA